MRDIRQIIEDAGGYAAIVTAYGSKGIDIDSSTPRKWPKTGIPVKHWPLIIELAKSNPAELMAANQVGLEAAA